MKADKLKDLTKRIETRHNNKYRKRALEKTN